jgi:hypothetical protein
MLAKLKETHPKLFGADGKLPDEIRSYLVHAQGKDGVISKEEFNGAEQYAANLEQLENPIVPNLKPAATGKTQE